MLQFAEGTVDGEKMALTTPNCEEMVYESLGVEWRVDRDEIDGIIDGKG